MRKVVLLLMVSAAAAWPQCPAVIDDFRGGKYKAKLDSGTDQKFQTGTMFGGGRRTVLIVGQPFTTNPFGLQGLAEIRTPPPSSPPDTTGTLIVSTGTRVNWVFELFYGLVAEGMFAPANHNFTGCNKFLVTVDSADTGFFILMNVYTNSLTKFSKVQVFIPPSLPSAPVASRTYEIPFSSFTSGSPDDANWSDVDFINVGFRAGNGLGGDDFSILSIKAVP